MTKEEMATKSLIALGKLYDVLINDSKLKEEVESKMQDIGFLKQEIVKLKAEVRSQGDKIKLLQLATIRRSK